MWIIARISFFLVGFLIRYIGKYKRRFKFGKKTNSGIEFGEYFVRGKSVHKHLIAVPLKLSVVFEITPENMLNYYLKKIGFSAEIQTGDTDFDNKFYIASDHIYFNNFLKNDPLIREYISEIFGSDFKLKLIGSDGNLLFLEYHQQIEPTDSLVEKLQMLSEKLTRQLESKQVRLYQDKFLLKVIFLDSFVFATVFYGVENFFELMILDQYRFQSTLPLFVPGTLLGLTIAALLIFCIQKIFKDSSRSHSALNISLLLLFLGLPFWGTKTFVDLNYRFDKSEITTKQLTIKRREIKQHYNRKSKTVTFSYWLHYREPGQPVDRSFYVPKEVYDSTYEGHTFELKSRNGAFGYPYRVSFNNIELQ